MPAIKENNKETKSATKQLAVFELGSKQYSTYVGKIVESEHIATEAGKSIEVSDLLTGKKIKLTVKSIAKGPKISMLKFKNKSRYLKRLGHRQTYSQILIESIS